MIELSPDPSLWSQLSTREREICHGLALGLSDKQIAFRYDISSNTVKVHLRQIRKRLGNISRVVLAWKLYDAKPRSAFVPKEGFHVKQDAA